MSNDIVSKSQLSGNSQTLPICPPSAAAAAYTSLRHTGFILDELCAQGLVLWLGDDDRWQWCWQGTDLESNYGFWAMGEALMDAVIGRYPDTFAIPNTMDEPE